MWRIAIQVTLSQEVVQLWWKGREGVEHEDTTRKDIDLWYVFIVSKYWVDKPNMERVQSASSETMLLW